MPPCSVVIPPRRPPERSAPPAGPRPSAGEVAPQSPRFAEGGLHVRRRAVADSVCISHRPARAHRGGRLLGRHHRVAVEPNVSLAAEDGSLRADVDFSQASYGWLRRPTPAARWTRVPTASRAKAGPGCKVSVHLMTDATAEKPPTLATVDALRLGQPDGRPLRLERLRDAGQRAPVPPRPWSHRSREHLRHRTNGRQGHRLGG